MSFGPFLAILQCITSKKLQKIAQNRTLEKKISPKKRKIADFFLRRAISSTKMVKNLKFFCSITSYVPNDTEKNFCDHWSHIREMNSRFLKKNVSPKILVRLESLPIPNRLFSLYIFLRICIILLCVISIGS